MRILEVSEITEQIKEMCNKVVWLNHGEVKMIGPTEEVCKVYEKWTES